MWQGRVHALTPGKSGARAYAPNHLLNLSTSRHQHLSNTFTCLAAFHNICGKYQLYLSDEMGIGCHRFQTWHLYLEEELLKTFGSIFTQTWTCRFPIKVIGGFIPTTQTFLALSPTPVCLLEVTSLKSPLLFYFPSIVPTTSPLASILPAPLGHGYWTVCKDGVWTLPFMRLGW